MFKSLLSGSHLPFTAELSWHYPTLLGCCVEHSAAAGTVQVQKKGIFSWNMVGQEKVKGKSVFLQSSLYSCRVSDCYTFMKETCAKIPFQNLRQGGATHWINANMVKGNNPSPLSLKNEKLHELTDPYPGFLMSAFHKHGCGNWGPTCEEPWEHTLPLWNVI